MSANIDLQTFDIGNAPNDGNGDDVRSAFQKVTENFNAVKNGVLDIGTTANTNAAGNDYRLVGSVQKIDSIAALRSLAIPLAADSGRISLYGYYVAGDKLVRDYYWDATSTATDDGGSIINPTAHTGAGRWVMVWDHNRADVRDWGAQITNIYSPTFDSLTAINAAINALPAHDFTNIIGPGAGAGGHVRAGIVYFAGCGPNFGFAVSGTIYASSNLRLEGDNYDQSKIALMPNAATNMAVAPTYVVWFCENQTANEPNQTFFSEVCHLGIYSGVNNPNSIPLRYVGCNGNGINHVILNGSLQNALIIANSLAIDHLTSLSSTTQTGVTIQGSYGLTCHNWDIEHSNYRGTTTVNGTATLSGNVDPNTNLYYPAVRIAGSSGCVWDTISTEASAISVEIYDSSYIKIGVIHANPNCDGIALNNGAANLNIHGTVEGVAVDCIYNGPTGGVPNIIDTSGGVWTDVGGNHARSINYTGTAGRCSYYQDVHFERASFDNIVANNLTATTVIGNTVYASDSAQYLNGNLFIGSSNPTYGMILNGYYGGATDNVGPDGRFRLSLRSIWNGNSTLYGTIDKNGWGIMKDNPICALDVNGSAAVSGSLTVNGGLQLGSSGTQIVLRKLISAVLVNGSVTVTDSNININSNCFASNRPVGYSGTLGALYVSAQSAGSVTITSTSSAATNSINITIEN